MKFTYILSIYFVFYLNCMDMPHSIGDIGLYNQESSNMQSVEKCFSDIKTTLNYKIKDSVVYIKTGSSFFKPSLDNCIVLASIWIQLYLAMTNITINCRGLERINLLTHNLIDILDINHASKILILIRGLVYDTVLCPFLNPVVKEYMEDQISNLSNLEYNSIIKCYTFGIFSVLFKFVHEKNYELLTYCPAHINTESIYKNSKDFVDEIYKKIVYLKPDTYVDELLNVCSNNNEDSLIISENVVKGLSVLEYIKNLPNYTRLVHDVLPDAQTCIIPDTIQRYRRALSDLLYSSSKIDLYFSYVADKTIADATFYYIHNELGKLDLEILEQTEKDILNLLNFIKSANKKKLSEGPYNSAENKSFFSNIFENITQKYFSLNKVHKHKLEKTNIHRILKLNYINTLELSHNKSK